MFDGYIHRVPSTGWRTPQMIEDCHRRFRDDALVEELIALLETHVRADPGYLGGTAALPTRRGQSPSDRFLMDAREEQKGYTFVRVEKHE